MPRTAEVTLGGRKYTIESLPISQSKKWREKLALPFAELSSALQAAGTVELSASQLPDISQMIRRFSGVLLGSIDAMMELLFEYSSVLAEDREWIEENAYDEEALEAFGEALKLAFPLGILIRTLNGPMASRTSQNSPTTNGATGTKHATASRRTR